MSQNNSDIKALEQASQWKARKESGTMTPEETREFDRWLAAEPAHQQAYGTSCFSACLLDDFAGDAGRADLVALDPDMQSLIADCDSLRDMAQQKKTRLQQFVKSPAVQWMMGIAAALVVVVLSVIMLGNRDPAALTYATRIGDVQTVMLKDGSVITLNTDTRVSVALSETARRVLLDHGEAYFDVAKDQSRPFTVVVGKNTVRAVGTAFNIKKRTHHTKVTVTEGIVTVHEQTDGPKVAADGPVSLKIGHSLTIDPTGFHKSRMSIPEIEKVTSWREGMIHFEAQKLSLVVRELQYYAEKEIIFARDDLKNIVVSGFFDMSNVTSFLKGLETTFPLTVVESNRSIILTKPRKAPAPGQRG